jgi:hypothetical protein
MAMMAALRACLLICVGELGRGRGYDVEKYEMRRMRINWEKNDVPPDNGD